MPNNRSEERIAHLITEGRVGEAQETVRSALEAAPDNPRLHNFAGICAAGLGNGAEAERYWQRAIELDPSLAQSHFNLGLLYADAGLGDLAARHYREVLALDPDNPETSFNLGTLLLTSAPEEAERHLQEAIRFAPQSTAAHANLALLYKEQRRAGEAEAHFRKALALDESSVEMHFNLASFLATSGRLADREEAKTLFVQLLELAPQHFGAWSNLGKLLFEMGYASAAKTAYTAAITYRPAEPLARINLGNILLHLHELEAAREQFSAALELDADLAAAHQGLASLHQRLGQPEVAAYHRERGFRHAPLSILDYFGGERPIPLLVLASASGGNVPWLGLIDQSVFQATLLAVEYFEPDAPLPVHELLFNAVGDVDLCPDALARAQAFAARSKAPIVNPPEAVLETGRIDIPRRLGGLPGVAVPRTALFHKGDLLKDDAVERLRGQGFAFPLLLRAPGYHGGDFFSRVAAEGVLAETINGLPGDSLFAIEYLEGGAEDGLFRKFRVLVIDGALYPIHMALSPHWKVHYFSSGMEENPAYREEEARFLNDFTGYLGAEVVGALQRIGAAIDLDYFGIDFGVDAAGNVLVYEANATMSITPATDDPMWDYKRDAIGRGFAAAHEMFLARLSERSRRGDENSRG